MIYITTSSVEEARSIGATMVEEKLAACANILPSMNSVYRWEGKILEDSEAILILKTRKDLVEPVTRRVRERHSYTVPAILALDVEGGNSDFLNWIIQETNPSS